MGTKWEQSRNKNPKVGRTIQRSSRPQVIEFRGSWEPLTFPTCDLFPLKSASHLASAALSWFEWFRHWALAIVSMLQTLCERLPWCSKPWKIRARRQNVGFVSECLPDIASSVCICQHVTCGNKSLKVDQEWVQSGNKVGTRIPKVGQRWKENANKVGTRTPKWDKSGNKNKNKAGTRTPKMGQVGEQKWALSEYKNTAVGKEWEQSGNKNTKVGQEWEQSGNKNPKAGQEWEQKSEQEPQSGARMETKWEQDFPKWDKDRNKMGTKWKQEPQSGTKMGTKWEQDPQSGSRMATKWEQNGNKVGQEWE